MNYIRHLNAFFLAKKADNRLTTTHVSVYLALFHTWNLNHFQIPHSATREDIMSLSGLGSKNTYHKCLRELEAFGYIVYKPSNNPFSRSRFQIKNLNEQIHLAVENETLPVPGLIHHDPKIGFGAVPNLRPFNKQNINIKNLAIPKIDVPFQEEVNDFFIAHDQSLLEAERFFLFYESIGWLVAGKTPIQNWRATAKKWIINQSNFIKTKSNAKNNYLQIAPETDYTEPF